MALGGKGSDDAERAQRAALLARRRRQRMQRQVHRSAAPASSSAPSSRRATCSSTARRRTNWAGPCSSGGRAGFRRAALTARGLLVGGRMPRGSAQPSCRSLPGAAGCARNGRPAVPDGTRTEGWPPLHPARCRGVMRVTQAARRSTRRQHKGCPGGGGDTCQARHPSHHAVCACLRRRPNPH